MEDDRVIFKYEVPEYGLTLEVGNPKVVMVDSGWGNPIIWIEQDLSSSRYNTKSVTFVFFGTGHRIPKDYVHVGSCRTPGGELVWHVYKKPTDSHSTINEEEKELCTTM